LKKIDRRQARFVKICRVTSAADFFCPRLLVPMQFGRALRFKAMDFAVFPPAISLQASLTSAFVYKIKSKVLRLKF
jgi:hypothetical protein